MPEGGGIVFTMASNSGLRSSEPSRASSSAMGHAYFRVGIQDRKIQLVFVRVKIDEQVVDFV